MGRLGSVQARFFALSDNCARRTSACLLWGPVTTDPRLPVAVAATQPGQSPGAPHRGWRVAGQQAGAWRWHSWPIRSL